MDPRIQKMADLLVHYSVEVRPDNWVVIQSDMAGEPLADACARSVLQAGGQATVLFRSETIAETILREGSDAQLSFIAPTSMVPVEQADAFITILAPSNTRGMSGIDPGRITVQKKAQRAVQQTIMRRWESGEFLWTIAQFPTPAAAQDANMSLRDYEDFVYRAGLLEEEDTIAAWGHLRKRQQHLIEWLACKSEVHITGPGTDLTVNVAGRTWGNDDGRRNFPGGEIFTGPEEGSTRGVIRFNYPAVYQGREINGIWLRFEQGEVVDAGASTDEAYLHEMLGVDEGAKRLGEFAFATNPGIQRFSRNTLFDEKISGTLHMALGLSVPGTGGVNKSALHWDIVYNLRVGAEVTVDDQLFSRNGEFCI